MKGCLLEVVELTLAYDDIPALWDVDLCIQKGEIVALVGSNGAGKTTLLKGLAGLLLPRRGAVRWEGRDISQIPAPQRVELGISLVPERRQLFAGLSVADNLRLGAFRRNRIGAERTQQEVYDLFPELAGMRRRLAGSLSGGEQQMCAIGRALMARPELLMIDELSLGLAPVIVDRLITALESIHKRQTTLLLVEQDVAMALELAQRAYVLETGRLVLQGPSSELRQDPRVKQAYLGLAGTEVPGNESSRRNKRPGSP